MLSFRFLLALPLAVSALAQANRSGCAVVTLDEATMVLGPGTSQRDVSGICIFSATRGSVTVSLTPNASAPFQMMKITSHQNSATVKEEPSIGVPAFSVVAKDGHGFTIFVLKGTVGAAIGFDAGPAKIPEPAREKLRGLAKKAVARM